MRLAFALGTAGLFGVALVYGCGEDGITLAPKPDSGAAAVFNPVGVPDAGTTTADARPSGPPALGPQIDRAGRPLVNLALNHAFDPDASAQASARAEYAQSSDAGAWSAYIPEIAKNLAVWDALDQSCGNLDGGYAHLAALLADDRLELDTSKRTCTKYLAVEQSENAGDAGDCGGRALGDDVVDVTYELVTGSSAVTDGVGPGSGKTTGTVFPYLVAPSTP